MIICIKFITIFPTGLEAQLLGIVVRKERPDLEEKKDSLVRSIAEGKKKLVQLEDEILRYVYGCPSRDSNWGLGGGGGGAQLLGIVVKSIRSDKYC